MILELPSDAFVRSSLILVLVVYWVASKRYCDWKPRNQALILGCPTVRVSGLMSRQKHGVITLPTNPHTQTQPRAGQSKRLTPYSHRALRMTGPTFVQQMPHRKTVL